MPLPPDVRVLGAGVVGQALALCLARDGLHVQCIGAAAADGVDVRAYALNAASRALLQSLRAWPSEGVTAVQRMHIHGDRNGRLEFDAQALGVPALAWIADVPALQAALRQALAFQPRVVCLDATNQDVAQPDAALTVACEGRDSVHRTQWGAGWQRLPYAQRAVAARLVAERPHGAVAHQWFSQDGVLALLPMDGETGNLVALVWSVMDAQADRLLALDDGAFAQAVQAGSHGALGALRVQGPRAAWPLQLAQADRWCGPGWALAGDAAHTVHPLAGQGLNEGLADVATLAKVLAGREHWRSPGDVRLLRRYERARKAELVWMRGLTDGLQRLFEHDAAPVATLRNWGLSAFDRTAALKAWAARQAMGLHRKDTQP